MTAVYFFYGLSFFTMGVAVILETRRASALPFRRHLPWLAAFAIMHSLVEWSDMFLLIYPDAAVQSLLHSTHLLLLPASALLLIRFGSGLVSDAGPLPDKITFLPPALLIPVGFLAAYAVTVSLSAGSPSSAAEVWSRYLLYFPACLLAGLGFLRQWKSLENSGLAAARTPLFGAALAFFLNAVVAGLIVPSQPNSLASWLNQENVLAATGIPVQVWRSLAALTVAICVVRTLDVFDAERVRERALLQDERDRAQSQALDIQAQARQNAEDWTNSLVAISRRIADMEDVDAVLQLIVREARRLLSCDTASLGLLDESGAILELKCYATAAGTHLMESSAPVRSRFIIDAVRVGQPFRYPEDRPIVGDTPMPNEGRWICPVLHREILSALVVPLRIEDRALGAIWVGRYGDAPFGPSDLFSLERLADQTVIALEHSLMAARMQSIAVLEERSRLAREMHDGLAQILGYLSLEIQTLEILAQQDNRAELIDRLQEARVSIGEAHAEVRENILSLRTTLSGDLGVIAALQQYVEEYGVQTGIDVSLHNAIAGMPHISPLAEAQLVRIVQEALTNVRKHARARHVSVDLQTEDGHLAVSITDDGVGFQVNNGHDRFGVRIMHERADSIGGKVTIMSQNGKGTTVHVLLPLVPAGREGSRRHVSTEGSGC